MSHPQHNDIVDELNPLSYTKRYNKRNIRKLMNKYDIDISYDDHLILLFACVSTNWSGIRACLKLGGDPRAIMDSDLIVYDMEMIHKIGLDSLFRSYGFECNWVNCSVDQLQVVKLQL